MIAETAKVPDVDQQRLARPLSPELQRLFPKLCKPRKRHRCRLCGGWIEIKERCCRWNWLDTRIPNAIKSRSTANGTMEIGKVVCRGM